MMTGRNYISNTRAGYRFAGWNTKDDGTGTKLDENVEYEHV